MLKTYFRKIFSFDEYVIQATGVLFELMFELSRSTLHLYETLLDKICINLLQLIIFDESKSLHVFYIRSQIGVLFHQTKLVYSSATTHASTNTQYCSLMPNDACLRCSTERQKGVQLFAALGGSAFAS